MAVRPTIHAHSPPSGCTGVSLPAEPDAIRGSPALLSWLLSCPLSCTTAVSISVVPSDPPLSVVSSIYSICSFMGATDRLLTVPPEAALSQRFLRRARVCSVQFKIVSMRSEQRTCAPPRLSYVSPVSPLKRSYVRLTDEPASKITAVPARALRIVSTNKVLQLITTYIIRIC